LSYLLAFLGFAALILLHETGHFVAAKAVGMRVERFSLFFGPLLVKVRRGDTEYGIGPIPLGGYVKITGMNPAEEIAPEYLDRAYFNQPVWKRVVVILAGPAVNLLIAFGIIWVLLLSNGQQTAVPINRVAGIEKGSAAAGVLHVGDRLVSIDGVSGTPTQLRNQIAKHKCEGAQTIGCLAATPADVVVRRDGRLLTFALRPRYSSTYKRGLVGFDFGFATATSYPGTVHAASLAVTGLWSVTKQTASVVARVFEPRERKQLSGIVGGYTVTQESFARSPSRALEVLALISLSLAIINLFPFLPLDGGHVFWAVAEKVRGRRIPFVVMERAGVVGFVLILFLFVIGLSNDISTLTGPGFGSR
jgi:regulator of sigma E protease